VSDWRGSLLATRRMSVSAPLAEGSNWSVIVQVSTPLAARV